MVTMVLLNVALMWAMPRLTLRRCLRFLLLATVLVPVDPMAYGGGQLPADGPQEDFPRQVTYLPASLTPFLPATVFRGPLRVRALVRVRWPRTGRPLRWRRPRSQPMSRRREIACWTWRRSWPSTVYSLSSSTASLASSSSDRSR